MEEDIFKELAEDILDDYTYTPQINSFRVQESPQWINAKIKNLEKNGYVIYENDFEYVEQFLKSPFFEKNRQDELKKHLDENYHKYLFDKIFNNIDYIPIKLNGVPCKSNYGIANFPSGEIKDFLLNGTIPDSRKNDILFYSTIIDFCQNPYFGSEFCYEKIKRQLQYIEKIKPNLIEQREIICKEKDRNELKSINSTIQEKKEIHVNENLKQQILSKIPENFNQLEKSIFIYLKLCDYFSYDSKFFANQNNHLIEHEAISNIEKLSQENSDVVCFEFTYALSDILESIGIKCVDNISYCATEDDNGKLVIDTFINRHANLKYIVGDTIVFADSTRTVMTGDISEWKYSMRPTGIRCENYSLNNREIFNVAMRNVIDYIKQYEDRFHMNDIKEEYDKLTSQRYLDMRDKMIFICEKIVQFPYDEVDLIAYINRLKRIVFSEKELHQNFSVIPIKNTKDEMNLLISANKLSFKNSPYNTQYYSLDIKTKQIKKQIVENIIKGVDDRTISTVEKGDVIPALKMNSDYLKEHAEKIINAMENDVLDVDGNVINQYQENFDPFVEKEEHAPFKMGFTEIWLLCLITLFSSVGIIVLFLLINNI